MEFHCGSSNSISSYSLSMEISYSIPSTSSKFENQPWRVLKEEPSVLQEVHIQIPFLSPSSPHSSSP